MSTCSACLTENVATQGTPALCRYCTVARAAMGQLDDWRYQTHVAAIAAMLHEHDRSLADLLNDASWSTRVR